MIERAIGIALMAHAGQKDKYGVPYILHPLKVGLGGRTDEEITAGILHDVIEDSPRSIDDLRNEGFPDEVLEIVEHLTKQEGEEWHAYIARVMEHEPAMQVKLRDLEQNMDTTRVSSFGDAEQKRFTRYVWAWHAIRERLGLE